MSGFDYELGDRVPMNQGAIPEPQRVQQAPAAIQEELPAEGGTGQTSPSPAMQTCKFNEEAINEVKQQIASLQDLFVRRLYDDKQKGALISSLEEKATFAYIEPFLSDIILILDRLERANTENSEFATSIADELYEIINRRGVERIKVTERFNPAENKAVRVENDDTADSPRVSRIIRNGYTFSGKVIRPAEVVVAQKRRS